MASEVWVVWIRGGRSYTAGGTELLAREVTAKSFEEAVREFENGVHLRRGERVYGVLRAQAEQRVMTHLTRGFSERLSADPKEADPKERPGRFAVPCQFHDLGVCLSGRRGTPQVVIGDAPDDWVEDGHGGCFASLWLSSIAPDTEGALIAIGMCHGVVKFLSDEGGS